MKLRFILISLAVLLAIGGAFATRVDVCEGYPQYRKMGSSYVPAGEYGYNYICWDLGGVCTYYRPYPGMEIYYPCKTGAFEEIIP